ncbi:MAG: putative metalloprotease CJM1_0395 family protein [Planctomycetota bacterium]|jgi:hypothetical protein|nr:putative metalloprotease CJM1_0395 family protein [Planctomycetota bacterium]
MQVGSGGIQSNQSLLAHLGAARGTPAEGPAAAAPQGPVETQRSSQGDSVSISAAGRAALEQEAADVTAAADVAVESEPREAAQADSDGVEAPEQEASDDSEDDSTKPRSASGEPLSEAESSVVRQLQSRDREVRTHEQAHLSAAGQYAAGGASFSYQNGPDGKRYAIGGEVPIDTGTARTPEATINKMQQVKRAALAPANPSGADRSIAASAAQQETGARTEIAALQRESAVAAREQATAERAAKDEGEATNSDKPLEDDDAAAVAQSLNMVA